MDTLTLIAILAVHFVADFVLQSDVMAQRKSTSNKWLTIHIAMYSAPFVLFGPLYALVNGVAHWLTDYVSSRATTRLWKAGERHWFFVVIGADQFVHVACLVVTAGLMRPVFY